MDGPSRRAVLRGTGVVAAAGVVGFAGFRALAPPAGSGPAGYPRTADGTSRGASAERLAAVSDIPDGGGLVVSDRRVVLVRDGSEVHAFTAVCTHQGCLVRDVSGGEIHCPCHGSAFDAATGAAVQGPATEALAAVAVVVRDGEVFAS